MTESPAPKYLTGSLLLLVIVTFAIGFALGPLYDLISSHRDPGAQPVDESRQVRVQFQASNAVGMAWQFYPVAEQMDVHPGAVSEMLFVAQNPSDKPMTAQAVPSISPAAAAVYFHKTECFCFTQQVLQPGQRIEMPVRFIVDRDLPKDVQHLTLGYTLFDVSAQPAPQVPAAKRGG